MKKSQDENDPYSKNYLSSYIVFLWVFTVISTAAVFLLLQSFSIIDIQILHNYLSRTACVIMIVGFLYGSLTLSFNVIPKLVITETNAAYYHGRMDESMEKIIINHLKSVKAGIITQNQATEILNISPEEFQQLMIKFETDTNI